MMLVTGALLGGNIVIRRYNEVDLHPQGGRPHSYVHMCGWPHTYRVYVDGRALNGPLAEEKKGRNFWFALLSVPAIAVALEGFTRFTSKHW